MATKQPKKKAEAKAELVVREKSVLDNYTAEALQVIRNSVGGKDLTDSEFKMYLMSAQRLGADPLKREMHAVVFTDRQGRRTLTLITGIDFFRRVATSNKRYNGTSDAEFGPMVKRTVYKTQIDVPEWAKIKIWLKDAEHPVEATAYFDEYLPGSEYKQSMWKKMPRLMIAKCAESLAIRKAFPQELSGVYTDDETQTFDSEKVIEVQKASKELLAEIQAELALKGYDEKAVCTKYKCDVLESLDQKTAERILIGLKEAPVKAAKAIEEKTEDVKVKDAIEVNSPELALPKKADEIEIPVIEPEKQ